MFEILENFEFVKFEFESFEFKKFEFENVFELIESSFDESLLLLLLLLFINDCFKLFYSFSIIKKNIIIIKKK